MIRRLFLWMFYTVTIFIGVFFLGIQFAYVMKYHDFNYSLDPSLIWFQGNNTLFYLLLMISTFFALDVLYNMFFNRRERERRKEQRRLTRDEKISFSHVCSVHEAKKGLQRLEFDNEGYIRPHTFRGFVDKVFDKPKKLWNNMIVFFKINDVHKFNTLKYWGIGGRKTCRRGGFPILTYRNRVYVDPTESHNLVIGTTNSGKTFSTIHIMIDTMRMAGESMVINDLKGELLKMHKPQLEKDGYKVIVLNFVEPNKSDCWNPLGIIIKKYREAQRKYLDDLAAHRQRIEELKSMVSAVVSGGETVTDAEIEDAQERIRMLEEDPPEADFSEAFELLKDIANTLCYDANAKDPFWNSQAGILMEGLVNLLLEEGETDPETGEFIPMDDEYINLKSVKLALQAGNKPLDRSGKNTVLSTYLNAYRKPTDGSMMKLKEYVSTAENTKGSITSVFADKLDIAVLNESIMRMTSHTDFDLRSLGTEKTAVFLVVHDEKKTYYPLVSIFVKQLYEELIKTARGEDNLKLPVPVNLIYDEFGISPAIKDVDAILAAARSRGVRMTMVIQDFSQLDNNYGKDIAKSIKNNVMNVEYLLGGDPETLKEVSNRAGNKLQWNKEKGSYEAVPVISTERLGKLSLGEAVILRQRRNPIITRLRGYDRYPFYQNKPKGGVCEERLLSKVKYFDLEKAYHKRKEQDMIKNGEMDEQGRKSSRSGSGAMEMENDEWMMKMKARKQADEERERAERDNRKVDRSYKPDVSDDTPSVATFKESSFVGKSEGENHD